MDPSLDIGKNVEKRRNDVEINPRWKTTYILCSKIASIKLLTKLQVMETFFNVTFNLVGKVSVKLKSRQNQ